MNLLRGLIPGHRLSCSGLVLLLVLAGSLRAAEQGPAVDMDAVRAAGVRVLEGKHLRLFTDVRSSTALDEFPAVFDQAFLLWCDYFHVDPKKHDDWQLNGSLMHDQARFRAAGLLGADVPRFLNGYSRNYQFWLNDQASDYYQRHLMLHEGTHSFMFTMLGGFGPPWYSEGMAELLATHRWHDGKLQLAYLPQSAAEVPKLGRVEIVETEFAAGRGMQLGRVMNYDTHAHLKNEPYGWCWAAAAFLDGHPKYQKRFRELPKFAASPDFNAEFTKLFADDATQLNEDWQVFVADIGYGYDFARCQIDYRPGQPLPVGGGKATVAADRGWQNTGYRVDAGKMYLLQASGRYQLAERPKPWISEPNGVSIRYRHGQPLGIVLATVRADDAGGGSSGLVRPLVVGARATLAPRQTGTLYLRINDFPGELADNQGSASVEIKAEP